MTEHTKIPLPEEGKGEAAAQGKSLLERAVRQFGLGDFKPAPVPDGLEPKAPRRVRRKSGPEQQAVVQAAASPAPATGDMSPPDHTEVMAPVAEPVAPVRFTGARHQIDRANLKLNGMIVPEGPVTTLLEEFRIVKRQLLVNSQDLLRQGSGDAGQRILIASPHPGEGKSYCAVNLALSIAAEMESEVLLVDADFAKPSLPALLGLPEGPGLMDALMDERADVADFVVPTDIPGLFVLPAGHNATTADTEYLASSRAAQVLARLTQGAPQRIVLFDTSPVLAASSTAVLAKYVGQVVVVVRADQTGQGSLDDAISLLSACPNIQLLLNGSNFSSSGRSFGIYHEHAGKSDD